MLELLQDRIKILKPFYERNAIKDIFSWKDLENLLNFRPSNTQERFKVFLEDGDGYEWPNQAWVSNINCFPPSTIEKITKKYLCHLSDSSRVNEKINTICRELEIITNLPTDAHIYFDLTGEQNVGFGIHFDFAHNLIVQVEGKSNVRLWDVNCYEEEKRNINNLDEDPIFEIVMEPGDVFYAPAHYYHEVKSLTKRLSISFPSITKLSLEPQEREWLKIT
jgi:hypothetical protein